MEKVDRGNIHCATYSRTDPFDVAQSMIDDLDGVDIQDIKRIVECLFFDNGLSKFGMEVLIAIEAIKYDEVQSFYINELFWSDDANYRGHAKYEEMCERFKKWKEGNVHIEVNK
jgi:hypothetical protein